MTDSIDQMQKELKEAKLQVIRHRHIAKIASITNRATCFVRMCQNLLRQVAVVYNRDSTLSSETFWEQVNNLHREALELIGDPSFDEDNVEYGAVLAYYNIILFMVTTDDLQREPEY